MPPRLWLDEGEMDQQRGSIEIYVQLCWHCGVCVRRGSRSYADQKWHEDINDSPDFKVAPHNGKGDSGVDTKRQHC